MYKLTFCNQKGGVGKTTLSVHIAHTMHTRKLRILFFDLDVQGNSSLALNRYKCGVSSFDFLSKPLSDSDVDALRHFSETKGFALVHASFKLANAFKPEQARQQCEENFRLLEKNFDVVIFDTNPFFDDKFILSLVMGYNVYIPLVLDSFSLQGLNGIFTIMARLVGSIKIRGLILNKTQLYRKRQRELYNKILASKFSNLVLENNISFRESISESLDLGKSLFEISGRSKSVAKARIEFEFLTDEILEQLNND